MWVSSAGVYFVSEVLNFVNVIGQIYLLDRFFFQVILSYQTEWASPNFPLVTKCTFHMNGPSGDIEKHDAVCLLPKNALYGRIFGISWYWYQLLALISFGSLMFWSLVLLSQRFRIWLFKYRAIPLCNPDKLF